MAITTYAELKSSIANWLNRDDLTAVIPDFIALAESSMNRSLRHWRMEKRSTATIDSRYSALPGGFLSAIRFHLDADQTPIELVSAFALQKKRQERANTSGRPRYYAVVGGQLEVCPSPDASYTGELYYYDKFDELSDSNTTNWLLTNYPDAYLYGALLHAAPYLAEDARAETWAALYQTAIGAINSESDTAKTSGSGLRMQIGSY